MTIIMPCKACARIAAKTISNPPVIPCKTCSHIAPYCRCPKEDV